MANSDVIKAKPSFDALQSMTDTVRAFSDLVDVIPRDDSLSSLLRILSERLDEDLLSLRRELPGLWAQIPDSDS